MHWVDTAILLVLGLGAVTGAMTGFLWQVARIVSLGVALYATLFLNAWATELLQEMLLQGADPRVARALAYAGVFLTVFIFLYGATRLVHHGIQVVDLEGLDRFLGSLVGVVKMAVIVAGMCYCLGHYQHPKTQEVMEQSTLAPILADGMRLVLVAIPDEYKEDLRQGLDHLREWAQSRTVRSQESGIRNQESGTEPDGADAEADEP
jgi:membrane protein required for colicin V production